MDARAEISVIIPCFNYGGFLKESLSSVSAQTLNPIETLIIDDGSNDPETLRILSEISDPGVSVIRQENRGLPGARNTGLRHAMGDYVYFLDADDILFPFCLEKLAEMLNSNPDAIAACSGVQILGGRQNGMTWLPSYDPYLILVRNLWAAGMMLRKRALEEESLWYDESMRQGYEDWEFNIRLTRSGHQIEVIPQALYSYRVHARSMLAGSRTQHAAIISHIRDKHRDAYTGQAMIELKRGHAPALRVSCTSQVGNEISQWIATQTFSDYIIGASHTEVARTPYYLVHAGMAALLRLPSEALETGLLSMEANLAQSGCILGIRTCSSPLALGSSWKDQRYQPVAMIMRSQVVSHAATPQALLKLCHQFLHFSDQTPGLGNGWEFLEVDAHVRGGWDFSDLTTFRKHLSSFGGRLLGQRIRSWCVKFYDFLYYQILFATPALNLRRKIQRRLGARVERLTAKLVYGLFLSDPKTFSEPTMNHRGISQTTDVPPLFVDLKRENSNKIKVLLVTAWLNQGGVEQEILDLCNHLDPSRFDIIVATTKRSFHPWEELIRRSGASVYHLGDLISPRSIHAALAQLILTHHVNVLYIFHSKEAYEGLHIIKKFCPFLCVTDRNVTLAGGFPKISAKIGGRFIDRRTVGHAGLAQHMARRFGLGLASMTVVYAGTDLRRVARAYSEERGRLHRMCNLSTEVPIVLYLGRLDSEKRPHIFLQVARRVFQQQPSCAAHFVLVGDGERREQLEAMISKFGLTDRVHLLGFQTDPLDLLADSALLMIPSAFEGLALVSYEAMALGVPQISADVGGQKELITDATGILIKNGPLEVRRYAKACIQLLSDSGQRSQMAERGRQRIRSQFTTEQSSSQYGRIFEECAELSRKRTVETPFLKPPHINPLRESNW